MIRRILLFRRHVLGVFLIAAFVFALLILTQTRHSNAQKFEVESLTGTISGRVFEDFNGNGVYDTSGGTSAAPTAIDVGVSGVTVTVYDSGGATQGSGTTNASGIFSISAGGTGPYRVEFTGIPAGYFPSARSTDSVAGGTVTDSGSTIQFVPDGSSANVNLGLVRPADYCQNNPAVCSQLYGLGAANQPEAIFTIPYTGGSTRTTGGTPVTDFMSPGNTSLATTDQVGTTFGIAYNRYTNVVYAAAFVKKHAKLGPGGTGAIYRVDRNSGAVSEYVNLNTVFGPGTAGNDPHNMADLDIDNGQTTWNAVGKSAFGGMAISDDMQYLFVMNLADRQLYRIPTSGTLDNTTITSVAFPSTFADCTNANNVRPFAVTYYRGSLYLGAVCSSETGSINNLLRMYVLQADPVAMTIDPNPLIDQRLNYTRNEVDPSAPASWRDWTTTFTNLSGQGNFIYPQPVLTDLDIDNGNLIVSFRDRMGDQTGYFNRSNPNNTNDLRKGITGGDIIRFCGSPGSWTLESNGRCGGNGNAPQNSNEGPGGGEFYYQDNYHPSGNPHDETSNGAAHQIPGHVEMIASIMDPVYIPNDNIYDAGGFRWFSNTTGAQMRGYLAYAAGDFGKANGMGNVIALCDAAPIEIGNRVWLDSNANGVQDAGENGIAGVTVRLFNGANALAATAVTDANGEFYFVSGSSADPNPADNIGIVNGQIARNANYEVRIDRALDYQSGGPLFGMTLTAQDQNSQPGDADATDSDAANVVDPLGSPSGTFPVVALTTGSAGANDHKIDLGFTLLPTAAEVAVDGRVLTSSGQGIRNVVVTLTEQDGTVHRAVTGTFGYYAFENIEAGQTVMVRIYSKRFRFDQPVRVVTLMDAVSGLNFTADD